MATEEEKGRDQQVQAQNLKEREALGRAYGALVGQQNLQAWSAFTFEDAVDNQIEEIEGKSTQKRPNQLDRVDRIEQDALSSIARLKDVPPEKFIEPDPDTDVNTPEE